MHRQDDQAGRSAGARSSASSNRRCPIRAETEIIANVVTSPHHLDATMVEGRVHRMTELFGRLAPGVDLEAARAELRAVHGAMVKEHPESYPTQADFRIDAVQPARSDHLAGANRPAGAARGVGAGLHHRLLERREPDPRALGAARRRAGDPRGARRQHRARCAGRCWPRAWCCAARARFSASLIARPMVAVLARYAAALLGPRARRHRGREPAVGRRRPRAWPPPCCSRSCRACRRPTRRAASACRTAASASPRAPTAACACSRSRRSPRRSCCSPAPACC